LCKHGTTCLEAWNAHLSSKKHELKVEKRALKTGNKPMFRPRQDSIKVDSTLVVPTDADVPIATVGSKLQAKALQVMAALETVDCMKPKSKPRKLVDSSGKKWKRVKVRRKKHKSLATDSEGGLLERAQTVPADAPEPTAPCLKRMQTTPSRPKRTRKHKPKHKPHFRISKQNWSKDAPADSEPKKKVPVDSEQKKVPVDALKKDMVSPDLERIVSLDSDATRRFLAKDQENHKDKLRESLWSTVSASCQ